MKTPLVSIVILNFNGKDYTKNLLDSIEKIDFPKEQIEIIVVDNGSSDGSQEFVRKNYPYVKQIENKKNLGFDEGTNVGVRAAKGKYVAMLSNDIVVEKNWLKELVRAIESDKKIGIVDPTALNKMPDGKYVDEGYGTTSLFHTLAFRNDVNGKPETYVRLLTSSAACLYRRELVDVPFDKDYFAYAEDTYFGLKVRLMGYEIIQAPKAIFYHEGSATIKKINLNRYFDFLAERNKILNILTIFETKTLIKLIPLYLMFAVMVNIYDIKTIKIRVKAFCWIIGNFGTVLEKRKKIQALRRIKDKELFPLMSSKLKDEKTIRGTVKKFIARIFNGMSFFYCRFVGIKTMN